MTASTVNYYTIEDLANAIGGLSYGDMLKVSNRLSSLQWAHSLSTPYGFADLLTQWAIEYKEKSAEKK